MIYSNGEWSSELFRRVGITSFISEPRGMQKLVGQENEYLKSLPKLQGMAALRGAGKPGEALKVYDALPPAARKEKCFLVQRCLAAVEVGGKTALDALDDFPKAYPGNVSFALLSLGTYANEKKYEQALTSLGLLEMAVGGDAYLDYQRSEIHYAAGDFDKARKAALKAVEEEKELPEPFWMMIAISLQEKKHTETVKWLTVIEKERGVEVGDLREIELYKDFVQSPEYREWMKSRAAPAPAKE
jgi:tetratricopeptide (TPR) repeat protein